MSARKRPPRDSDGHESTDDPLERVVLSDPPGKFRPEEAVALVLLGITWARNLAHVKLVVYIWLGVAILVICTAQVYWHRTPLTLVMFLWALISISASVAGAISGEPDEIGKAVDGAVTIIVVSAILFKLVFW